jgi:hypothetical protein
MTALPAEIDLMPAWRQPPTTPRPDLHVVEKPPSWTQLAAKRIREQRGFRVGVMFPGGWRVAFRRRFDSDDAVKAHTTIVKMLIANEDPAWMGATAFLDPVRMGEE